MSTNDRVLISCLMPTRQRLEMAKRAIDCFAAQDYTPRELVIVCDGHEEREPLSEYGAKVRGGTVTVTSVDRGSLPLGSLRNRTTALARGEVFCQWDDDDLSHPSRISTQFAHMQREGADVCFMTEQLLLITRTRSLYWCDWSRSRGWPLPSPTIPNTLMCYARAAPMYVEQGPLSRRSGDAAVMRGLLRSSNVARLSGLGWLYVYVSHGGNIWAEQHHQNIVRTTGLDAVDLAQRRRELSEAMTAHAAPNDLIVRDYRDEPVFTLGAPEPSAA
jgi:glycosyltransferase involved in cell wall biosynthesis